MTSSGRRSDSCSTSPLSRPPSSRRLSEFPVRRISPWSSGSILSLITPSMGVLLVEVTRTVSPRSQASATMAATVWLLPVPGGPVITWWGRLEEEPCCASSPVSDARHPLQILDQAAGREIQFAFERHHQVEDTDLLGPPGIAERGRVSERGRIEQVSGQTQYRHQSARH